MRNVPLKSMIEIRQDERHACSDCRITNSKPCIVKDMKQTSLLRKKKSHNKKREFKLVTLEEWLLNSPIMKRDSNFNAQNLVRKNAYFSDSGLYSLSLEQLLVLDGVNDDFTILSSEYHSFSSKKLLESEKVDGEEMRLLKSFNRRHQSSK
ncbi:hypothetical protein RYX36_005585, partial [Vicia faba]